jgi:hypothetical protein
MVDRAKSAHCLISALMTQIEFRVLGAYVRVCKSRRRLLASNKNHTAAISWTRIMEKRIAMPYSGSSTAKYVRKAAA